MQSDGSLTFGLLFDLRNPMQWRQSWPKFYAEVLEFVSWADELGFKGVWFPEHHGAEDGYIPSPLIMAAAVATRTRQMRLGTSIALAPLHHPVRFAEECALVDILSNGRLDIGFGLGYRQRETDMFGIDFRSRGSRMEVMIDIMRRLWAGESVTHEGRHFNIRNAAIMPRPVQGKVPIFIGGFSEKAIDRAARIGDGFVSELKTYDQYRHALTTLGKPTQSGRFRTHGVLHVSHDPEKAFHELAPYGHYMNNAYAAWLSEDRGGSPAPELPFRSVTLDEFRSKRMMRVMTPEKAIDVLRQMLSRAPVEHYVIQVPPGMPLQDFAPYAELFARQVIPAFSADQSKQQEGEGRCQIK